MKKNVTADISWIAFIARRYVSKKGNRSSASSVLSILGIAVGVLSLTVILSVMNGFQLGFIESIIEISSYHIRVDNFPSGNDALIEDIRRQKGVLSAAPFKETRGLLRVTDRGGEEGASSGEAVRQSAALVRGLAPDAAFKDAGMAARLEFEQGFFNLEDPGGILLGAELAAVLGARMGSVCEFLSISGLLPQEDDAKQALFTVRGIFHTGFYEYDLGWAFIGLEDALRIDGVSTEGAEHGGRAALGIKIKNREADRYIARHIQEALQNSPHIQDIYTKDMYTSSWRDYNKAFFNALRTEKLMMFVLVGLIFIITAMNIYNAQKRSVLERGEEIALLCAVGGTPFAVRLVFTLNGVIVGFLGAVLGMTPALLIVTHIRAFFSGVETIINAALSFAAFVSGGLSGADSYYLFSPAVFYLKEIPARIIPREIVLIFLFGFFSAVLASFIASARVTRARPAETLRYE